MSQNALHSMEEEGERIKHKLNESLKGTFGRKNDYDCVAVLAIHWKESDLNFESEALKITTFFETKLLYHTEIFPIPSSDSLGELKEKLDVFLLPQRSPRALYIIHYGGHGDRDFSDSENRRRRGVWAARAAGGTTLNWSDIQPSLGRAAGDVLLILDCCYGAQAAREPSRGRVIPGNVELLAACGMGVGTPGPGSFSFTSKLIKELETKLQSNGCALVSAVHTGLLQEDRNLSQTPIRTPLLGRRESIRLERLESLTTVDQNSPETALLAFHIPLIKDLTETVLDETVEWLKDRPPAGISSEASFIAVVLRAQPLRGYICHPERETSVTAYEKLSRSSNRAIQKLWLRFGRQLQSALSYVKWPTPVASATSTPDPEEANDLAAIVRKLEEIIVALQNTVDQSIQEIPKLNEEVYLEQAIEETALARLQATVESLKIRRIAQIPPEQLTSSSVLDHISGSKYAESKPFQTLVLVNHGLHKNVLAEYKYYDKENMTKLQVEKNESRMRRLVKVLETPTPGDFGTLQCLGWSPDPDSARNTLIFELPEGYQGPPTSLREIILNSRHGKPTLGQRFIIAKSIGQALLKWHTTGWVHQSIASHNVTFFRRHGSTGLDLSKPFLCGFEYARVVGTQSIDRHPDHQDAEYDLYRHKDRQGGAIRTHKKEHDLYSFGLLLLEIGLWDTLKRVFFHKKDIEPAKLRGEILKRQDGLLSFDMGKAYEEATMKCITGSFLIVQDDTNESRLAQTFEAEVLQRIVQGYDIDTPRHHTIPDPLRF